MLLSGMLISLECRVSEHAASTQVLSSLTRLTSLSLDCNEVIQVQDSLSLLQTLSSLCQLQLISIADSCTGLAALLALQQLSLSCLGPICDLASCTQLTSLVFTNCNVQKICLPINGAAQLQYVFLDGKLDPDWEFTLENLGAATQLTHTWGLITAILATCSGQMHCHSCRSSLCLVWLILSPRVCSIIPC